MEPFRFHKLPEPPEVRQAPQSTSYVNSCSRPKHGKMCAAGIPAFVAGVLQSRGSGELAETSNLVFKFAFKMSLPRFQKLPNHRRSMQARQSIPVLAAGTAGMATPVLQASSPWPQAP